MRNKLIDALKTGGTVPVRIVDLLNTLDGSIDVGDDDWIAGMFAEKVCSDFEFYRDHLCDVYFSALSLVA